MLQIAIIIGWAIAVVVLVLLAVQAVKHRFVRWGREDCAEDRRQAMNPAGAVAPPHEAVHDYRRFATIIGFLALFLWEAFWISGITERFKWSSNPFQLPYFFLLVVLVGIPLAVYLFARRALQRSASSI